MVSKAFLMLALQFVAVGLSHAHTRDQTIILAMLGQAQDDKSETAAMRRIVTTMRVDDQTINIEINSGGDSETIQIRESPKCVFSIGSKGMFYAKINFGATSRIFTKEAMVWLEGDNVSCSFIQGICANVVPLTFLDIPDKLNIKQFTAAKILREHYCDGILHTN